MKYRKKPVVIEAYRTNKEVVIHTLEGDMKASVGDYIITGVNGEQYPCKPDIFYKTYELVRDTNFDRIREMSLEEMAELYVDFIMRQKNVLSELESTSAVVIEAVRRDLYLDAVHWLNVRYRENDRKQEHIQDNGLVSVKPKNESMVVLTQKEVCDACKKQIPTKAKYTEKQSRFSECSVCGHLVSGSMDYCVHCGQKLLWERDTE